MKTEDVVRSPSGRDQLVDLAKEAGYDEQSETIPSFQKFIKRFAALVRADLMKQVMDTCEAEYKLYDELVVEEDTGHEECCALIHLMRKLDKLRPATGKAEREWVDLTCEEVTAQIREGAADGGWQGFATRVQTAFKEKNK